MNTICSIESLQNEAICADDMYDGEPDDRIELAFGTGSVIFAEGSPITGVYCIRTGRVALLKRWAEGDDHITSVVLPGTILGVPGVFTEHQYINGAIAMEPTSVWFIPKGTFLRIASRHPEIVSRAIAQVANRIRLLERHIDTVLELREKNPAVQPMNAETRKSEGRWRSPSA